MKTKSKPNQKKKCKDLIRIIFTIKINLMAKYIFATLTFAFKEERIFLFMYLLYIMQ